MSSLTFKAILTCDDGGVLKIADRVVVDNYGLHSAIEKNGQVALQKAYRLFGSILFKGGSCFRLKFKYSVNVSEPKEIPSD